ncbi:hypothetical protein CLF_103671 [Clonorchis sinensis]|uniref:Uncharacterized protein n=1 Tax=Clonorchis sinensis TaxID=79923 RepID=G7YA60_CLOSI|nr:hypothetical protein CLF_103671 [Clonorchis sinensis]
MLKRTRRQILLIVHLVIAIIVGIIGAAENRLNSDLGNRQHRDVALAFTIIGCVSSLSAIALVLVVLFLRVSKRHVLGIVLLSLVLFSCDQFMRISLRMTCNSANKFHLCRSYGICRSQTLENRWARSLTGGCVGARYIGPLLEASGIDWVPRCIVQLRLELVLLLVTHSRFQKVRLGDSDEIHGNQHLTPIHNKMGGRVFRERPVANLLYSEGKTIGTVNGHLSIIKVPAFFINSIDTQYRTTPRV